jgi:hypothetical protein
VRSKGGGVQQEMKVAAEKAVETWKWQRAPDESKEPVGLIFIRIEAPSVEEVPGAKATATSYG